MNFIIQTVIIDVIDTGFVFLIFGVVGYYTKKVLQKLLENDETIKAIRELLCSQESNIELPKKEVKKD